MKTTLKTHVLFTVIMSLVTCASNIALMAQTNGGATSPKPPMAEKKPKTTNIHGVTLIDDYFWLREKTNPAVMAHLEAENAFAEEMMKPTSGREDWK